MNYIWQLIKKTLIDRVLIIFLTDIFSGIYSFTLFLEYFVTFPKYFKLLY